MVEQLRSVSLFSKCSEDELARLADIARVQDFDKGHVLCRQDTDADEAYAIASGKGEVTRDGRYLARVGPGDVVGELALITGAQRGATVRLIEDSRVVVLPADRFTGLLEDVPALTKAVLHELAERLQKLGQASVSNR